MRQYLKLAVSFCVILFIAVCLALEEISLDRNNEERRLAPIEYAKLKGCLEDKQRRCLVMADQKSSGIYVYEVNRNAQQIPDERSSEPISHLPRPIWSFDFMKHSTVPVTQLDSFKAISDVKLIYKDYFAFCTSGGIIGVIDIERKWLIKWWYVDDANLHSLDITPDGAIFAVASEQNFIVALPSIDSARRPEDLDRMNFYQFPYGHAVVFDYHYNQVLWVGGNRTISSFKYNYYNRRPEIKLFQKFYVDDDQVHDVTPIPDSPFLWMTTWNFVYLFNTVTGDVMRLFPVRNVKSISTMPDQDVGRALSVLERLVDPSNVQNIYRQGGIKAWKQKHFDSLPVMLSKLKGQQHNPEELEQVANLIDQTSYVKSSDEDEKIWWTDQVLSLRDHKPIFKKPGAKFYKGRYLQFNSFSYELFFPKKLRHW